MPARSVRKSVRKPSGVDTKVLQDNLLELIRRTSDCQDVT